jgi:hypothetical protein
MIKSKILPQEDVVITGFNINNVLQNQIKRTAICIVSSSILLQKIITLEQNR